MSSDYYRNLAENLIENSWRSLGFFKFKPIFGLGLVFFYQALGAVYTACCKSNSVTVITNTDIIHTMCYNTTVYVTGLVVPQKNRALTNCNKSIITCNL